MANNLNGIGASALTANGVLVGAGSGTAITSVAVGTNGQVLTGVTAGDPVWGSLTSNPAASCNFLASQTGDQSNVTGDGTTYTVTFTNEIYDVGNNFDGTSTFTAPATGKYMLGFSIQMKDLTTAMTNCPFNLVTTAATYRFKQPNFVSNIQVSGIYTFNYSTAVDMSSGNTAIVQLRCIGGTKVADVTGTTTAGYRTPVFWGYRII